MADNWGQGARGHFFQVGLLPEAGPAGGGGLNLPSPNILDGVPGSLVVQGV